MTKTVGEIASRAEIAVIVLVGIAALFPLGVKAAPWACVADLSSPEGILEIDSSQWDPDECYNNGPQGELSNLISQIADNVGDSANEMCSPVIPEYSCGMVRGFLGFPKPGQNMHQCPCFSPIPQIPGAFVEGVCAAQSVCVGRSYTDLTGKTTAVGDLGGIVGDIFKGVLDRLMQSLGDQGSGFPDSNGCTSYYTVSSTSSDPCARLVVSLSDSLLTGSTQGKSTADQLLKLLESNSSSGGSTGGISGGGTGSNTSQSTASRLLQLLQNTNQNSDQNPSGSTQGSNISPTANIFGQGSILTQTVALNPDGTSGDIQITGTGATIFGGSRDVAGGTEIAGFYGGDTGGFGQSQGIAARLCLSRPWATSFISYVIPSGLFDGLCSWRGYQVGFSISSPTPTSSAGGQQGTFTSPVFTPPATSSAPLIEPKVDIWTVPNTITIGARASVFWNTQGVTSCAITSSDGSFSETSLSGGAATVPIIDETVFTIMCVTPDNRVIVDEVVIGLGI